MKSIAFNTAGIVGLSDGWKTMTRRLIKPQPAYVCGHDNEEAWHPDEKNLIKCPYKIGDRLSAFESNSKIFEKADAKATNIILEITNIKVERVQDISEEDVVKEGIDSFKDFKGRVYQYPAPEENAWGDYKEAFKRVWDSIYGAGAWERNDFVRVYEFKKVKS